MKGPARLKLESDVAEMRPGVVRTTATEWRQAKSRLRRQAEQLERIDKRTIKDLGTHSGAAAQAAIDRTARRLREEADLLQIGAEALDRAADAMEAARKALHGLGGEKTAPIAPTPTPGVPLTDADHKAKSDYDTALNTYNAAQASDEAAATQATNQLDAAYRAAQDAMREILGRPRKGQPAKAETPSTPDKPGSPGTPGPPLPPPPYTPRPPVPPKGPDTIGCPGPQSPDPVDPPTPPGPPTGPTFTTPNCGPGFTYHDPHLTTPQPPPHHVGTGVHTNASTLGYGPAPTSGAHHGVVTNVSGATQGSDLSFGSTAAGTGPVATGGAGSIPSLGSPAVTPGLPAVGAVAAGSPGAIAGVAGARAGAMPGQAAALGSLGRPATPGMAMSAGSPQAGGAGTAGSRGAAGSAGAAGSRGAVGGAGAAGRGGAAGGRGAGRGKGKQSAASGDHLVFAQDWIDDEATAPEVLD